MVCHTCSSTPLDSSFKMRIRNLSHCMFWVLRGLKKFLFKT
jgi:hypothetical protein